MTSPPVRLATLIAILLLLRTFVSPLSAAVPPDSSATTSPAAFSCDNVTQIPKSECEALVALYNSTNGSGWTNNTGWLQTNTPCSWFGIICEQGNVIRLYLNNNQLSGPIPPQIGQLTQLQSLNLFRNQLNGLIPAEIGQLTQLSGLRLDDNQLQGPVPRELGQLAQLYDLSLFRNQLTGSIPDEIGQLSQLRFLWLNENQLSGGIPPNLGQLTELMGLYLYSNKLSGSIPSELGQLTKLTELVVYDNDLNGSIPSQLGELTQLKALGLSRNQLTGSIPTQLGQLTQLEFLFLNGNKLTGSIPPQLGQLTQLRSLDLKSNQLSGPLPSELGSLTNLRGLFVNSNQLRGFLPLTLSALTLTWFWYDETNLCEPGDVAFQTWLSGITDLRRTDIICGTQTVSGTVWNDANRNGIQDAGEAGLEGAMVTLTQTNTAALIDAVGRRIFTDANGNYRFDYVATGPHAVAVTKPGYLPTSGATVSINVPEGGLTVPPVGIAWAPAHIFLPLIRR